MFDGDLNAPLTRFIELLAIQKNKKGKRLTGTVKKFKHKQHLISLLISSLTLTSQNDF